MDVVEQSFLTAFNQTSDTIVNFKNRLTDNEYIPILNQLTIINSKYDDLYNGRNNPKVYWRTDQIALAITGEL